MSEVTCVRCGQTREGLERPPLPGPDGARVQSRVCTACWTEWKQMQVRIINEYRLSPANPEHFEGLMQQMRTFLGLNGER